MSKPIALFEPSPVGNLRILNQGGGGLSGTSERIHYIGYHIKEQKGHKSQPK